MAVELPDTVTQQEVAPWFRCATCGQDVIVYNKRAFRICQCEPFNIVLTEEGLRRGVTPE